MQILPTEAELEKIQSYEGDPKMLGEVEQFYRATMHIPRLDRRLDVFKLHHSFKISLDGIEKQIKLMKAGCMQLRGSSSLSQVIASQLCCAPCMHSLDSGHLSAC